MTRKWFFAYQDCIARYDMATETIDAGWPKRLPDLWDIAWGSPSHSGSYVDAAFPWGDVIYFFRGNEYARADRTTLKLLTKRPLPIGANWPQLKAKGFDSAIDSCFALNDKTVYVFQGARYLRYDLVDDNVIDAYPLSIPANWSGFKDASLDNGIEAGWLWNTGKTAYFSKGNRYVRFNIEKNTVDDGYPMSLLGNWAGLREVGVTNGIRAAFTADVVEVATAPVVTVKPEGKSAGNRQEYSTVGSHEFTVPTNAKDFKVFIRGGGGGGGGGGAAGGGAGGGGGGNRTGTTRHSPGAGGGGGGAGGGGAGGGGGGAGHARTFTFAAPEPGSVWKLAIGRGGAGGKGGKGSADGRSDTATKSQEEPSYGSDEFYRQKEDTGAGGVAGAGAAPGYNGGEGAKGTSGTVGEDGGKSSVALPPRKAPGSMDIDSIRYPGDQEVTFTGRGGGWGGLGNGGRGGRPGNAGATSTRGAASGDSKGQNGGACGDGYPKGQPGQPGPKGPGGGAGSDGHEHGAGGNGGGNGQPVKPAAKGGAGGVAEHGAGGRGGDGGLGGRGTSGGTGRDRNDGDDTRDTTLRGYRGAAGKDGKPGADGYILIEWTMT